MNPRPAPVVDPELIPLFGGIAGVNVEAKSVLEICPGLSVHPTYAHIFSYFMGAFERPKNERAPHPPPWRALHGGGVAFDVHAEVRLSVDARLGSLSRINSLWLFTAVTRLLSAAPIHMPAVASMSYRRMIAEEVEPLIWAVETRPALGTWHVRFDDEFASGVRACLPNAARLMDDEAFNRSFTTFDGMIWLANPAAQLIAIWTSMETAIRPGPQQITKKLARTLGDYLGSNRSERDRICNEVIGLYSARGSSTHNAQMPGPETIRASYLIARRMFLRILAEGRMPAG